MLLPKCLLKSCEIGKLFDLSKILHLQMFQFMILLETIPPFFEKVGKWKIFRFIGNFSSTANIPTHQILEEKFSIFPNWKIFHFLHSV